MTDNQPALRAEFLAAYRGEHLVLTRYPKSNRYFPEEIGLPYVLVLHDEDEEKAKERLVQLLNTERGSCVWTRFIDTDLVTLENAGKEFSGVTQFAGVSTCNFFGYVPEEYFFVKPKDLPTGMSALSRQLMDIVVTWRDQKEKAQADAESRLGHILDLKPKR